MLKKVLYILFFVTMTLGALYFLDKYKDLSLIAEIALVGSIFVGGFGFIITANSMGPQSSGYSRYNNIESLYNLRDAKISSMGLGDGVDLIRETQVLDMAMNSRNSRHGSTNDAFDLLNAKLGSMSQEDGLKYLKNK